MLNRNNEPTNMGKAGKKLIEPLRKHKADGSLYTRPERVEAKLGQLLQWPRDEFAQRCEIQSAKHPDYVPTECLLHFVRATRQDNSDAWFERLYTELIRRLLRRLPPKPEQGAESLVNEHVREGVLDRFLELLALDRQGYCEKLDFFEVAFDAALKRLKISTLRTAWRDNKRRGALENDETGELRDEVVRAAGTYDPFDNEEFGDPIYRSRLDAAIAQLPPEQREIMEMLRLDIPIESKDPNVMSIAKALGCVEKTVRNRRDRAFEALRRRMTGGEA